MLALLKIIALVLTGFIVVGLLAMFAPAILGAIVVITVFVGGFVIMVSEDK